MAKKELKFTGYDFGKVTSKKERSYGKEYAVIKLYIQDLFGQDREFNFFVNKTDMQFLGLKPEDFGIKG